MAQDTEEARPDSDDEEGGPVKSFLEHLEDLRWVLIKCGSSLGIAMVLCLVAGPLLIEVLQYPLVNADLSTNLIEAPKTPGGVNNQPSLAPDGKPLINTFGPIGGMVIAMKIALYGGMVLSIPLILFFIGQFVMPALRRHEKTYFLRAFIVGAGLFLLGVLLCYFYVLPISLVGMVQFNRWLGLASDVWRAEEYFSFVIMFMVGMGLSFEIPVLILSLVKLGLIEHEWLVKGRKYFFVGNLVLCAFITPDFLSTLFMVIPVQILMEICIRISAYWERKKQAEEHALAAAEPKHLSSTD